MEFPFNHNLKPNNRIGQFFYTEETLSEIISLVRQPKNSVCLGTPSVFMGIHSTYPGSKTILLDRDPRLSDACGDLDPYISIYDINRPTGAQRIKPGVLEILKRKSPEIIIDPPFDTIRLEYIASRITELLDYSDPSSQVLMTHQITRQPVISRVFERIAGLNTTICEEIPINYTQRLHYHENGRQRIVLFRFTPYTFS
ncbi:MAG: hypothetical protein QY330_03580 [Candidatus Dojkabacteria bacterium]|uniref:Uncharacterized protein n=2 Tax=Candidatus Dojkabacteria TaxID=74243 RepID=A0A952AJX2_9BACT|nr:MAG: putative N6-adenine methyltransferase [candidate division WS6 bacterium OLB21]MBW7953397.1 hypothetical protein [Candidatus Dojkabacteria bacterium]WKZ27602.1 MAG: hypothetical protein QY330_03580 [Candidatus Dojkabacteria bacterium]